MRIETAVTRFPSVGRTLIYRPAFLPVFYTFCIRSLGTSGMMGPWPLVLVELDMGSGGKAATFQGMGIMVAFLARRSNGGLANAGVGLIHTGIR